ncbi:MAG: hypothetical protein EPN82_06595 [Bacteroidetes bacterium]|nr:MAG: hypothetical protein EPN82_06595 [Bacteroidota bacterium]
MLKLAVPNNPVYDELLLNKDKFIQSGEINLYRLSECECSALLLGNKVDAALFTPMDYAKGILVADYRVIPDPALISESYTEAGTIILSKELKNVKIFTSDFPDDFMITIGKLILGERYNLFPEIEKKHQTIDEMTKTSDIVITWNGEKEGRITLDISEEWFDLNETALPLAFWVCKAEQHFENLPEIIASLASDKTEIKIIEQLPAGKDFAPRDGRLLFRWNDNFEHALEFTLHFLYYHQLLNEIPAVKILGRD